MPDLTGLSARAALVATRDAELELELEGTGRVVEQSRRPGRIVERGARLRAVLQPPQSGGSSAGVSKGKNAPERSPGMVARADEKGGD